MSHDPEAIEAGGGMTDERAVEAIAEAIHNEWPDVLPPTAAKLAQLAVAGLEGAGFRLYRPEECEKVEVEDGGEYADYQTGERRQAEPVLSGRMIEETRCMLRIGSYRLVSEAPDAPMPANEGGECAWCEISRSVEAPDAR